MLVSQGGQRKPDLVSEYFQEIARFPPGPTEVMWHAKARMNAGASFYIVSFAHFCFRVVLDDG